MAKIARFTNGRCVCASNFLSNQWIIRGVHGFTIILTGLHKVSRSQNHPKVDLIFPVQPHAYDKWPFCNLFQLPEQTHLLLWATLLLDISERTGMKNATTVLDPSELENYNQLFWDLASRKLQKKFWTIVSEPAWKIHTTVPDLSEQASLKITLKCPGP